MGFFRNVRKIFDIVFSVTVTDEATFHSALGKLYNRLKNDNSFVSKTLVFPGQENEKNIQEFIQQYQDSLIRLENMKADAEDAVPYFEKINAELLAYTKEQEQKEEQLEKSRQLKTEKTGRFDTESRAIEDVSYEKGFYMAAGLRKMISEEKPVQAADISERICHLEEELEAARVQKENWDQKKRTS